MFKTSPIFYLPTLRRSVLIQENSFDNHFSTKSECFREIFSTGHRLLGGLTLSRRIPGIITFLLKNTHLAVLRTMLSPAHGSMSAITTNKENMSKVWSLQQTHFLLLFFDVNCKVCPRMTEHFFLIQTHTLGVYWNHKYMPEYFLSL